MRQINMTAQRASTGARTIASLQPLQNQAEVQFDDGADEGDFFDAKMNTGQTSGELIQSGAHTWRGGLEVVEALRASSLQRGGQCA